MSKQGSQGGKRRSLVGTFGDRVCFNQVRDGSGQIGLVDNNTSSRDWLHQLPLPLRPHQLHRLSSSQGFLGSSLRPPQLLRPHQLHRLSSSIPFLGSSLRPPELLRPHQLHRLSSSQGFLGSTRQWWHRLLWPQLPRLLRQPLWPPRLLRLHGDASAEAAQQRDASPSVVECHRCHCRARLAVRGR